MKTLGERIRELREALDKSLRELAGEVDVTAAFLSDVELGRRYPREETLRRIAKRLQTSFEELSEYDRRPPLNDLKRKSVGDSEYGFALRRLVEEDLSGEELLQMIKRHKKRKKPRKSGG